MVKKHSEKAKTGKPSKVVKTPKGDHPIKKKKLSKRFNRLSVKAKDLETKAILYVGHLPHGFNEEELKGFFGQFGEVTKFRISRSPQVSIHKCNEIIRPVDLEDMGSLNLKARRLLKLRLKP